MSRAAIPLGPFDLHEPIGEGGFAVVWGGVHRDEGVPVAVKVLTADGARDADYVAGFRNEVRAAAGLDHPSIVVVYDHGVVPPRVDALSEGRLLAGSPYLVMERLDGGTLHERCGALRWPELRGILLQLLDALAHAHARGVVHRDLKPGNVLLDPGSGAAKLSDFGVAHAVEHEGQPPLGREFQGTPPYMAPEQFECRWRDYGPWTDLYGLGCVAWALATGAPPFGRALPLPKLMQAHLEARLPPLRTAHPSPPGLRLWLGRLLAKEPRARWQRAADAAWALLSMPDLSENKGESGTPADDDEDGGPRRGDGTEDTVPGDMLAASREAGKAVESRVIAAARRLALSWSQDSLPVLRDPGSAPPPLPSSWQRRDALGRARQLGGAGLGLYGLRPVPLVDRERERDLLWSALSEVRERGAIRAVVLRGPAGYGKSRLAEWLSERAHEVGAATPLFSGHGPRPGPADGLGAMLARHLRCTGLARTAVAQRLELLLQRDGGPVPGDDDAQLDALTELVCPATGEDRASTTGAIRFRKPLERWMLLASVLTREARRRPVLLRIDDVQWGLDALSFCDWLLSTPDLEPVPLLLLLTVRDEALVERPAERAVFEQLIRRPGVAVAEVGPLPSRARRALVRDGLGLEGELAAGVEARCGGNPLFAVQLVGDLVERGSLEAGRRGFRLRAGASAELPADLARVWGLRIERHLDGREEADARALELAAVLGTDVDAAEWAELCARSGIVPAPDLVGSLIEARLARAAPAGSPAGFSFVHGMLREAIERRARSLGRDRGAHRAAAEMLRSQVGPAVAERLGRHLLAAGEGLLALGPLLEGVRERFEAGEIPEADALLALRDAAIEQAALPEADLRWGQGWIQRARIVERQGDLAAAELWLDKAALHARKHGWQQLRARAERERGRTARNLGQGQAAWRRLGRAERMAEELTDRALLSEIRRDMSDLRLDLGDTEGAEALVRKALDDAEAVRDAPGAAGAHLQLGNICIRVGRLPEAERHVQKAMQLFRDAGHRWGYASAVNMAGEAARYQGRFDDAERKYRESLRILLSIGEEFGVFPETNLGLLLLERGQWKEARRYLEAACQGFERQGRRGLLAAVHAFLLPACAEAGDWEGFSAHLERAESLLGETAFTDLDIVRTARMAAAAALAAGRRAEARRAWALAVAQLRGLDRAEEAEDLEREAGRG